MIEKKILAELKTVGKEQTGLRKDVDDLAIATKNSFDRVEQRFNGVNDRFDGLEERMEGFEQEQKEMRSDINRLERGVKAILEVVQESNMLLKEFRTHPDRIARLEHRVFK